ncbi:hypothetical protein AVEN_28649-1 [Araneus ventricosus]|uniref:Uncharacterized protein n=1 Tax=Araneus ventricosus TaxID=182803 RepID=A0A4Y2FIV7_ARAVE|nr:hypothetical protein AVEN_28649-1 [Araneus ventricosus]
MCETRKGQPYLQPRPPDPSDYYLFGPLKKHLAGRHFKTNTEVQEAIIKWYRDLNPDFFYAGSIDWFTDDTNASTTLVTMLKSNMYQCLSTFVSLSDFVNIPFLSEDLLSYFLNHLHNETYQH